jgi:proline iminopeptidase
MNQSFMRPNQLIDEATVLRGIPGIIVHGRYDGICPVDQAWALHRAWPRSELNIIPDAGHAASEPGITQALLEATNTMAERFSG